MARLAPCPSCTRHVKVGSAACPFCGGRVPVDVPLRVFASTGRPLTRAAILFASATAVSACSSSSTPANGEHEAGVKDGAGQEDTSFGVLYGVFDAPGLPEDAGAPAEAGTHADAGAPPDGATHEDSGFVDPDSGSH